MNQILTTEKIYVTPEVKRKKLIYKLEFFLSVFLLCLLFSYYIYAEYDRSKAEEVSQQILADLKYTTDTTVKQSENDVIVVVLNDEQEAEHKDEEIREIDSTTANNNIVYKTDKGETYTTEAILKIPAIKLEYPVLSKTSEDLLFVSLNKYWGPKPNQIGNYCIVGHYYESGKMFGNLHKLKNGDTATLTNALTGYSIDYQVYHKEVVEPTDTSCTSQLATLRNRTKELTLITCTNHGKQRLVVKLREIR